MAKRGLRLIDFPRRPSKTPSNRHVRMDFKCKLILQMLDRLHALHGNNAVIHAYAKERGKLDGNGWFEVRGKKGRHYVDWSDPRRRTEHMAHMGLLDWIDKGVPERAGFRLNDDGRDFLYGNAVVKKISVFRGGILRSQHGPRVSIDDLIDSEGDREHTGVDD